jgi:hypothetical protein
MSSDKTELANESRLAASSPLDVVPDEIPFDVPYGLPISLARAQAIIHAAVAEATRAELEDERSSCRFRGELSCLPANGWRDACLNSDSGTQGASSHDLSAPNQDLRGRYPADASQLSARVRWSYRVSRWHSTDRPGSDYRRNRLFGRHGFPGRDRQQGRRGRN